MTTLTITTRPAAGPARPAPSVADDPRWARIVARDKSADGQFWYSVATTGVYCRPSCPSRRANPRNVTLYDTLEGARASGFRPCRRCNPDGPSLAREQAALVARACRIIEASEEEPRLEELAGAVGRSPGYFHRIFKAATGLTPKDYAAADRTRKIREGLDAQGSITEAIYDATDKLADNGLKFMPGPPETYYEMSRERVHGHDEPIERMKKHGILIDGEGVVNGGMTKILLQIFSKTVIGPIFFEFIQRKGDEGFGEGNFRALFESIEADQIRRGELGPQAAEFHAGLAEPLEDANIDLVFCAGPLMKSLWDALPDHRRGAYAQTAADLAPLVVEATQAGDVVMVKGSNGSKAGLVAAALGAGGKV